MTVSTVKYATANLSDIKVRVTEKTGGKFHYLAEFQGEQVKVSERFFNSLASRFQINQAMFNYFSPEELFPRVIEKHGKDKAKLRIAVEQGNGLNRLIAVSNPDRRIVGYQEAIDFIKKNGGRDIRYVDGRVDATFIPQSGNAKFQIGGDSFNHQFMMSLPIDGFGSEEISIGLLREVCANGITAMDKAFTSSIALGKDDPMHGLQRAVESFADEEGFDALTSKVQLSQKTLASVRECQKVFNTLSRIGYMKGTGDVLTRYSKLCGSLCDFYGESNLNNFSQRKQQLLPSKATVYDLMNFASELASHKTEGTDQRRLQALVGTMLTREYDLEGTDYPVEKKDFQDLFIATHDEIKHKRLA